MSVALALGGCATAPLERAGSLRSYDRMSDANGLVTRSQIRMNKKDLLAAKTIRIASTAFPARPGVALNDKERRLVANAVSRELCLRLSERFRIVSNDDDADLTVQATVTHATPTSATASGASKALSIAKTVALPGVPVPVPRLPVGLGSLSVEAEARDFAGFQKAAMVWARSANSISNSARVANEGDAYDLAADFGADFAKLVTTGESPFGGIAALPPMESIPVRLGGAPKYVACEAFGRFPGLTGLAGQGLGLPPAWTDSGAKDSPANSPDPASPPGPGSEQPLTQ
ncbi:MULTISPECIES: DUF3313 domain-containing protein [Bradyrhizobium]|uniref:DUF3313 domain-containing protein n=1 Tax=Bradyrhizobium arachidis TaxID=858423 RepID=A0AAE7TK91_9BRAD|nr:MULTISPECIES: DUF3313 domain-containing protein [Bradyrhizobium]QOG23566.1 DUF3313 family protein [Bradyrhizobium sp. SEMIA]QOZ71365.1 DUF3313 domain-containing protein [Bradyrhizobium arachidis]UFW53981.1 DUF3313 domain-containing protein [Bradyrhizobium arachidis]